MKRLIILVCVLASLVFSQVNRIPPLTLQLVEGSQTTTKELLQQGPLILDFWALWCAPCLKAMRHLDEFGRKYREQGLNVLAINLDTERSRSKVRSYIYSKGYEFFVALDPAQETFRRLNGNTMPYTLLIDGKGNIVYKHTGYVPGDERVLEKQIVDLLTNSQ